MTKKIFFVILVPEDTLAMKNNHYSLILILTLILNINGQSQNTATTFMVFSDPHYYAPSLGTSGLAFQKYLEHDRKLLKESRELMQEASKIIIEEKPDFVIVPGDLTKDGTLLSHKEFAQLMHMIEAKRIKVFVIPGNHDISNGKSQKFKDDDVITIDNVSPETYTKIYQELGFSEAIYRDENSLSYIAEPIEGIWLFGLDACRYKENEEGQHPITSGEFSKETLDWIESKALEGRKKGKMMIATMHHGILEHYKTQNRYFGDYVVKKHKKVSKLFAKSGIHLVFTGHYHSQDVTLKKWKDNSYIYDIETGSLVTFPCPLRRISISQTNVNITSLFIKSIPSKPNDFVDFSKKYVYDGIAGITENILRSMLVRKRDAEKIGGQISDAVIAHYQGDEPQLEKHFDLKGIGPWGKFIFLFNRGLIKGLQCDLPPQDNNLTINLENTDPN